MERKERGMGSKFWGGGAGRLWGAKGGGENSSSLTIYLG
jgi:hypothetical protein